MHPQRQRRLLRHAAITGAAAQHRHQRLAISCREIAQGEAGGSRVHLNRGAAGLHLRSLQRVHTRHQCQFAGVVHGLEDCRNLISTFVLTPDGLHHPEPLAAL